LRIGLEHGHHLTAFVRSPIKISQRSDLLKVIEGDVFSASQLTQCLAGHDCVLSAFGPSTLRTTTCAGTSAVLWRSLCETAKSRESRLSRQPFFFRISESWDTFSHVRSFERWPRIWPAWKAKSCKAGSIGPSSGRRASPTGPSRRLSHYR
jgi:hypothetical protein